MAKRNWTAEYIQQRLPAEIKELRRTAGKNPDVKPTHKWLHENGFSGIQGYAGRKGKTVDDVLLNECGFEPRNRKPLPGTHAETKQLIRKWLRDEDTNFARLNDTSVEDARSHMRRLLEISQEVLGSSNLLRPARAEPEKGVRLMLTLYTAMNDRFPAQGTRNNYASTLASFYDYLDMIGEVSSNPADKLLPRMGWSYTRESPKEVLKASQVRKCWNATKTLDTDNVEEFDTDEFREALEEKILILCLGGCGQRTSGPLITNGKEDIILDRDDPRICFDEERKNGPGTTPIMAGIEYFEQYIELLEAEEYEMLFPSDLSEDGTRSDTWVRNKIEEIVDRAGVRLPNGSKPTPKHFRQFWYDEYLAAYEAYISRVAVAAEAQSSASAEIVDKHYLTDQRARDHFRKYASEHFEAAFPLDVVVSPEEISAARDTDGSDEDPQRSLGDFSVAMDPVSPLARERLQKEHEQAANSDTIDYPPPPQRTVAACLGLLLFAAVAGVSLALSGTFWIDLIGGEIHATTGAKIGAVIGIGVVYRELPEL